jgi:hypothetical protein
VTKSPTSNDNGDRDDDDDAKHDERDGGGNPSTATGEASAVSKVRETPRESQDFAIKCRLTTVAKCDVAGVDDDDDEE